MADTYEKIIDTAYRLFAENGFEKTSMSAIAKEMGISKPAIYYYFPSKEQLIHTLFHYLIAEIQFSTFFNRGEYTKENFAEKLIEDGSRMISQQAADPFYEKIMNEYYVLSTRNTDYQRQLTQVLNDFLNGFVSLLESASHFELIESKDIETKAQFLTLIVDGLDKYSEKNYNFNTLAIWEFAVNSLFK
ncbi:TetR/AcrR family transcriptional regulator [Cytobacillus spongiae]|jgi:AcrR family transcriptional regulator|uniref:TetR/AcrR family transcriptional regulator n=1 Tax=Cytobacillus spongiae TaxID=2901381 RepID=UPI001F22D58C|nr:TetR/AcrR family transcriptional regulator [Cytobacillus spongiae]UII55839.1 TetR/AcrR family transcriptional regulator [Cytobacillus spongiae]